jgi:hypothetical protein
MANIITGGTYSLPMQTIAFSGGDTLQLCRPNPRRVAVGFYSSSTTMQIYPTSVGVILSQIKPGLSTNSGIWFLADDAGPLVQIGWYGYDASASSITIMEVVREG